METQSFLNPWDLSLGVSEYFNVDFPFKDRHVFRFLMQVDLMLEIWELRVSLRIFIVLFPQKILCLSWAF